MSFPLGEVFRPFYKFGYYGVEFFFVLSGFVTENGYRKNLPDDIFCFGCFSIQQPPVIPGETKNFSK